MTLYNVIQGTEEWHALRLGKMTASHAKTIAVNGKGLETYCREVAAERFTGVAFESYQSPAMMVGIEEEDDARTAYELTTGNDVMQVGFAEMDEFFGASPDGLVGLDGGIEIKRKTSKCHNDILLGIVDFEPEYVYQCHANMLVFDREWWDLVSYNPNFKGRSLFIKRIERDSKIDEQILKGIEAGKALIMDYLKQY